MEKNSFSYARLLEIVIMPLLLAAVAYWFNIQTANREEARVARSQKSESEQKKRERLALLMSNLSSQNLTERSLALEVANYWAQNDLLPPEMFPVIEHVVNPREFEYGLSDSSATGSEKSLLTALQYQPGFVKPDSVWIYLGEAASGKPGLAGPAFTLKKTVSAGDTVYPEADVMERLDLPRSSRTGWFKGKKCGILSQGQKAFVGNVVTLESRYIWAHAKLIPLIPSDYRIHFYGFGVSWDAMHETRKYLLEKEYSVIDSQMLDKKEPFLSDSSTVFYYSVEAYGEASSLSEGLGNRLGKKFQCKIGKGFGLPRGKELRSIYVHLRP